MEEQNKELENIINNIKMLPVISSNLVAIGYDENNRILKVLFKKSGIYVYFGVEPETYNKLISSAKIGSMFVESIVKQKDKYKYKKLN